MIKRARHLFFICFFMALLFAFPSMAQQKDSSKQAKTKADTSHPTKIFEANHELPEPPGGTEAFYVYLSKHIKMPKEAVDANAQGTVYITMVVTKKGRIKDVKVKNDPVGYGCAEEAMRVLKKMPRWKPAKMNGVPVAVRYTVPVTFKLD